MTYKRSMMVKKRRIPKNSTTQIGHTQYFSKRRKLLVISKDLRIL